MKRVHVISPPETETLHSPVLDDFSRFKEKVIMINTLKALLADTDKATYRKAAKDEGSLMSAKSLRRALETIVDQAIKRVQS